MRLPVLCLLLCAALCPAQTARELLALARNPTPEFVAALEKAFPPERLKLGTAFRGYGPDFVFAVRSASQPQVFLDGQPGPAMRQLPASDLWFALGQYEVGTSHIFHYLIDGKVFGGSRDVPVYGPDSYLKPGVPTGTLSDKLIHVSKIYDGLESPYWIYVPAQYDPAKPAALMVWQDGQGPSRRDNDNTRVLDAVDNLTHEKRIPVMIHVFIQPGDISKATSGETWKALTANGAKVPQNLQSAMRSVEYDTVSDRYARFLRDEILPEVYAKYNIRRDAYSRGISGSSSGGICAFNVAWQMPDQFGRVLSWIGSYVALKPIPDMGGQAFPAKIRLEQKRNIRVWLQDGAEDHENRFGSWPLQNIAMANSLKLREYDFHLSFGTGTHSSAQGSAEFPRSFEWLWRGYDSAKTDQVFEMDAAERDKPYFRVGVTNRDH